VKANTIYKSIQLSKGQLNLIF